MSSAVNEASVTFGTSVGTVKIPGCFEIEETLRAVPHLLLAVG